MVVLWSCCALQVAVLFALGYSEMLKAIFWPWQLCFR